jgi:alkylated DNA repair dioxygenase AlkB
MNAPTYYAQDWGAPTDISVANLLVLPWRRDTHTRQECFMAHAPSSYQYGSGRGIRQYESIPFHEDVLKIEAAVNKLLAQLGMPVSNGCFLNLYTDHTQHLGWHADDFVGMDHSAPVVVVSYGQPRELWFRENGHKGEIPDSNKQLLADRSLLIMPPGYQHTHQHKVPRGDRDMVPRVSLTFRTFFVGAALVPKSLTTD